jgi:uroporphyrinogen-III synthase
LRREYTAKALELNKAKHCNAEIPTIEDVIIEVIQYYNPEESIEPTAEN